MAPPTLARILEVMPLDVGSFNGINAVWFVPEESPWRDGVPALLRDLGVDEALTEQVRAHLDLRARGELDWSVHLRGALLPNGRPAPPVRLYNDRLQGGATGGETGGRTGSESGGESGAETGSTTGNATGSTTGSTTDNAADALPLIPIGPLVVAFDVWGAGDHGGEPGTLGLEVAVHRQMVHPWQPGSELWDGTVVDVRNPDHFAKLAFYGDAFAQVMARGCEVFRPVFALSDGMQPLSDQLARATSDRVQRSAPPDARLADFAWALMYWAPERLDETLRERLERLSLSDPTPTPTFSSGVEPTVRTLAGGGTFLQVRHILGSETRDARKHVETPLAKQLGLRSNHLLYKT